MSRTPVNLLKRYLLLAVGLAIMAFGVGFSIQAGLGTSPISSLPYVLSLFTPFTVGTATIAMHAVFVLLQILLLRRQFALLQLFGSLLQGFVDAAHQRGLVHVQRAETGRRGGGFLGLAQRGADHLQSGVVLKEEIVGRRGALRVRQKERGGLPSGSHAIDRRRWRICGSRTPCRCGKRWRDRRTRRW